MQSSRVNQVLLRSLVVSSVQAQRVTYKVVSNVGGEIQIHAALLLLLRPNKCKSQATNPETNIELHPKVAKKVQNIQ